MLQLTVTGVTFICESHHLVTYFSSICHSRVSRICYLQHLHVTCISRNMLVTGSTGYIRLSHMSPIILSVTSVAYIYIYIYIGHICQSLLLVTSVAKSISHIRRSRVLVTSACGIIYQLVYLSVTWQLRAPFATSVHCTYHCIIIDGFQPERCISTIIMLEMHHSGREPSICP